MVTHEASLNVVERAPAPASAQTHLLEVCNAPLEQVVEELAVTLDIFLQRENLSTASEVFQVAQELLIQADTLQIPKHAPLLINSCIYLFNLGRSADAISLGKKIAAAADLSDDIHVQRRIYNVLGWHYGGYSGLHCRNAVSSESPLSSQRNS